MFKLLAKIGINNYYKKPLIFLMLGIITLAFVSFANAEPRRGVMGCNAAGFGSVGSRLPSGAHVPVWDYAVSYNTNILIYKECILDGVNNAFKRAAVGKILQTSLNAINGGSEGFNGAPMFVENINVHFKERILNPRATQIYTGKETDNISSVFKQDIRDALEKSYGQRINKPYESYTCPIEPSKVEACLGGDIDGCGGLEGFYNFTSNTACNPLFAYYDAQRYFDSALRAETQREKMKLDWGNGFRSAMKRQEVSLNDGSTVTVNRIVTPGTLIARHAADLLGSGLRQLENADEIDEIIGLLMSNLGTMVLADDKGLAGIKPYLAGIVDEAYSDARGRFITLTLDSLTSAIADKNTILESLKKAARAIVKTKTDIRATDLDCLEMIITEAEHATKDELCISSMGTTTGCAVTISRAYNHGEVETFESSLQKVSMSGYARSSGTISTKYTSAGAIDGESDTTTGGTYNKYTTSGQDLISLLGTTTRTVSPYATETHNNSTYTTLGDFNFTGQLVNGEPYYKFSYDLPNVTITATSPTTTVSALNVVLNLKKNHSELAIERENSGTVGHATLKELYKYIGAVKAKIKELEDAKKRLSSERSKEAVTAAKKVLDKALMDPSAFAFANDMKSKISTIEALPSEISSCWKDSDGSGCGSAKWCTANNIKTNWNNYIE